jgi:hypothetical protein
MIKDDEGAMWSKQRTQSKEAAEGKIINCGVWIALGPNRMAEKSEAES